jgi:hypothetical protein
MPSKFVVVQYVPDPIANERINVGVLVYSENRVLSQFLTDWKRVKMFGGEDLSFLKEFARGVQRDSAAGVEEREESALTAATIGKWAASWRNSIQLTEPRVSLHEPEALLREAVQLFLAEPTRAAERPRGHQQAVALTKTSVRSAVKTYAGPESENLTRSNYRVPGSRQGNHYFDVAVANGVPYLAAQAISLEVRENRLLYNALDAIAWSIADTRETMPVLPIGVVILPPREGGPDYDALDAIRRERSAEYEQLGAHVLGPDTIEDWARLSLGPSFSAALLTAKSSARPQ